MPLPSLKKRTALFALLFAAVTAGTLRADDPQLVTPPEVEAEAIIVDGHDPAAMPAPGAFGYAPNPYVGPQGQYPHLDAPLYPGPHQNVPSYASGVMITNQAFAPHEMMYPHSYHAMYPPFYHKVKGSWHWTPKGMRQHEEWKLEGTEVIVNYRSKYRAFSGFVAPR